MNHQSSGSPAPHLDALGSPAVAATARDVRRQRAVGDSAGGERSTHLLSWVAAAQAFFYIVTGLWPLLSMATFQAVTGPKFDQWLVKTVATLILVNAAVLLVAALRRRIALEVMLLAIASALGLAAIDVIYVYERVIRPVYLVDAVAEVLLVALWISAWSVGRRAAAKTGGTASDAAMDDSID